MKRRDIEDKPEPTQSDKDKQRLLETARRRFKLCLEAEAQQRQRELEDLRFQVPEHQWDEQARRDREGDGSTPRRPCLSISKIDQPISLVNAQMRNSDLGVNVHPVSEDANKDTAEVYQGLYRDIERRSRANVVRGWAFDRSVKAGRGVYRVITEYDDESDEPSDQRITLKRILHQESVYFDPSSEEPDFSDAKYAFVVMWVSADEFREMFPDAKIADKSNNREWAEQFLDAPEWVRDDDVLVAEYWFKEQYSEEFEAEAEGKKETRKRDKHKIVCAKLCGWDVLEKFPWIGKYIPLIPVTGRELQPFDEERHWYGMIHPAKHGQQLYNYAASTLVENLGSEPKAPFTATPKQIEGYETMWSQANVRNFPVLFYNPDSFQGSLIPPPSRVQIDSSKMQLSMMALQEADQFIQASTAVFDPSLGKVPQKERSGRAIQALQAQADAGTSHYLRNLADVSITYEAKVVLDLIPKIYDREARVIRIIRGDDKQSEAVMINAPHTVDEDGKPHPAPQQPQPPQQPGGGMPMGGPGPMPGGGPQAGPGGAPMGPGMMGGPGGQPQQPQAPAPKPKVKHFDLRTGVYGVAVTVGKSFQTRLQEGSEQIGQLLSSKPELFLALGDIFMRFQDYPGSQELANRLTKMREKQFPGLGEGEDGEETPDMLKGKLEQMGQMMQALSAQLQKATEVIKTEQIKSQAQIQKAQIDAQSKLDVANVHQQTAVLMAEAQHDHDRREGDADRAHEAVQAEQDRQHAAEQAASGQQHDAALALLKPLPGEAGMPLSIPDQEGV